MTLLHHGGFDNLVGIAPVKVKLNISLWVKSVSVR